LQYAAMLPDSDFLLVATRRSGWVESGLPNVSLQSLASYACGDKSRREFEHLLARWEQLKSDLMQHDLASVLIRSGALDSFPKFLRDGLMIRDAWLQVFEQQPVQAVLCADDANFSTRIPLLIARARGIPAISCHHGALDGRHRFRPKQDCVFLAKSRMERDYMVRWCGVPEENVEFGAPRRVSSFPLAQHARNRSIIFFSEPYEAMGGRCLEFYREILPRLAETAAAAGNELVVKLHPAESLAQRTGFVAQVLSNAQKDNVHIVSGPLTDELLSHAWFAVTVLSTTAVDCTLRGIPVFLCQWLEYCQYEYVQQFAKFGAGIVLHSTDELRDIPKLMRNVQPSSTNDLWNPITPDRLKALLTSSAVIAEAV
ncbi:MAG TPA: hypothetical protein VGU90_09305, partial [Terriglobales bacterium]|nr:hypothetical protein [Terriglobales bacterium]